MVDHKILDEFMYEGEVWGQPTSLEMLDLVKTMDLTPEDVVVAAYPKSGTTWAKYIMSLMYNGLESADTTELIEAVPYLEFNFDSPAQEVMERHQARPSPRLLVTHTCSTHLQKQVHQDKVKVIAVMRNPKDTLVSYYHFMCMNTFQGKFKGTFTEWFELVKARRLMGGDVLEYNLKWWKLKELDNVLVVFYEDLVKEPSKVIQEIAQFCGRSLSEETITAIAVKTSFAEMKTNEKANFSILDGMGVFDFSISPFMRKGKVGDWRNHFNEEQNDYFDKRCKEECDPQGLKFTFELD